MFVEAPTPTAEQIAKADALVQAAADKRRREEESFQRSDTDGFLSQWANSIGARKDDAMVRILRNGGCAQFSVLCDAEGNVLADREYRFVNPHPRGWGDQVSYSFKLTPEAAEKYGRRWIPAGSKSRIQKKLGLHQESRWFPAVAIITTGDAKSTGLAGAANAFVAVVRKGEER